MLAQHQAISLSLSQSFNWGKETIPLAGAFNRVLQQEIFADRPQPPFDRVTMDGICINYRSYAGGQRFFPIERLQAAGDAPLPLTDPKKCVEIMTGAALPPGVSTVIRYEDIRAENGGFHLPEGLEDRKNIHGKGSDLQSTEVPLLQSGRLIGVAEIGMLATFGYSEVSVSKLPRVAVISTGNELVEVSEQQPADHQIRRSNVHQLSSLLTAKNIAVERHHLEDEPASMKTAIANLLSEQDILIFSGGVSKGKLDFVPEVLTALGVEPLFHGVAQRPGKPLWVGRTERCMVFGLPGNPVSSLNCLLLYVGPFIRRQLGLTDRKPMHYPLANDHHFRPDLDLSLSVKLTNGNEAGEWRVTSVSSQGSGDASSLLNADGFVLLPRGRELFSAGDRYPFVPLNQLF